MKPEITLTQDQVRNFSINVVDNFEGCEEATVFLKRIYGERTGDLRERGEDFKGLVKAGKSGWIINFLLNTITKPFRARYVSGVVGDHLALITSDTTKIEIADCMSRMISYADSPDDQTYKQLAEDYQSLHEKRELIKKEIFAMGESPITVNESKFEILMAQSQYLKGILYFLMEVNGNLTRSVVSFCKSLSEANQWKLMRKDQENHYNITMERCGLQLVDYVGYFNTSEEKEVQDV